MKTLKLALLAVLVVPALAGSAPPTQLHTSALNVAGNMLVCNIVNVSNDTISGSLAIIGFDGTQINASNFTFPPGQGGAMAANAGFDGYCKATFGGKADDVRVNLCLMQLGVGCIATSEAR